MNDRRRTSDRSGEWTRWITVPPVLAAAFGLVFFTSLFMEIPQPEQLVPVYGIASSLRDGSATITSNGRRVELDYPCIAGYGWGAERFDEGARIEALGMRRDGAVIDVWDLQIDGQHIFGFQDRLSGQVKRRQEDLWLGGVGFVISAIFSVPALRRLSRFRSSARPRNSTSPDIRSGISDDCMRAVVGRAAQGRSTQ